MFIIWGFKGTEKKLGYVAEYCTTCREVRTVKIIRVGRVFHLYYIPLGEGELVGYNGVCRKCELCFGVQITDYFAFESNKNAELVALARKTNPKLLEGNAAAVSAWERKSNVREPFVRYERNLTQRALSREGFDHWPAIAYFLTFAVPILVLYAAANIKHSNAADEWIGWTAFLLFVAGMIWAGVLSRASPQRFFRHRLKAQFIDEVRGLGAAREDLEACIKELRDFDYKIARLVTAEEILGDVPSEVPVAASRPAPKVESPPTPEADTASWEEATIAPVPKTVPAQLRTLLLTHGGKEYRFSPGVADIAIGRARENTIVLPSKFVSRSHVRISWPAGAEPAIRNLSRTGTSLRFSGGPQIDQLSGEAILKGAGEIGLAADFADAEKEGDVIRFEVVSG